MAMMVGPSGKVVGIGIHFYYIIFIVLFKLFHGLIANFSIFEIDRYIYIITMIIIIICKYNKNNNDSKLNIFIKLLRLAIKP